MAEEVQDKSRGAINLVTALVVAVVLAVVGFAAWKVFTGKDSGTGGVAMTAADKKVEKDCNVQYDNKDQDFCRFASHRSTNLAYEAVVVSRSAGSVTTTKISTDGPGNSVLSVSMSDKEVSSLVLVDGVSYRKNYSDGSWQKLDPGDPGNLKINSKNPASDMKIYTEDDTTSKDQRLTYVAVGKEACGKLTCFKYEIKDPSNSANRQFIWFDDKDYRLARWQAQDGNSATSSNAAYSYRDITINVPSPVR